MATPEPAKENPSWVRRGMPVFDTRTHRSGVINGIGEPYAPAETPWCLWLVPPGGGREWQTTVAAVHPEQPEHRC